MDPSDVTSLNGGMRWLLKRNAQGRLERSVFDLALQDITLLNWTSLSQLLTRSSGTSNDLVSAKSQDV
jgi:hypothetical protein